METISFDSIWTLLAPFGEFKRRRLACMALWESYSPAKQQGIYARIQGKKQRGEFVHENPYFAIEDNSREPAMQHRPLAEPTNYFGKPLSRSTNYYVAWYNGEKGLYTAHDVQAFNMSNPQKFEL